MDESSGKSENLSQPQGSEESSEVIGRDKKTKRIVFFIVAAIASFIVAMICLTFSILCFRLLGRYWDILGSLLGFSSILFFVAVPAFSVMACGVPFSDKQLILRERFARASRISFFIGIVFCQLGFCCGHFYFFTFLFFTGAFVLSMVSHIIFFRGRKAARFCAVAAIIFPLFGLGIFFANLSLKQEFLVVTVLPFLITALVLAIIVYIISFHSKQLKDKIWSIAAVFILSVLLLMLVSTEINAVLPYVYTPPALTSKNLEVYNECIEFVKKHDEYKNLTLWRGMLSNGREAIDTQKSFYKDEIDTLYHRLDAVRCAKFQRDNDVLLFYKIEGSIMLLEPGFRYVFRPAGPGVLYSLNGGNPNEVDSEVLNPCKPFIKIGGDWYMSRHLLLTGARLDHQTSMPKSLIDHSLQIKGIDFEITHEKVSQPPTKSE